MSHVVTVIKEIKSCTDCRHVDHSGAFTPGGSQPICGHSDACVARVVKDKYHWKNRVLNGGKWPPKGEKLPIPGWCPLIRGSEY